MTKIISWQSSPIPQYTFGSDYSYDKLTTIVIPNVTSIEYLAFNDSLDTKMQNLTKIVVNPNLTIANLGVRNGNADLYSTGSLAETNITINGTNTGLTGKIFYYSETKPADCNNTYWHYVSGEPTVWESGHEYINGKCTICGSFYYTEDVSYITYNGSALINGSAYTGSSTEIYIRDTYNGCNVTGLGDYQNSKPFATKNITLFSFPATFGKVAMRAVILPSASTLEKIIYWVEGELPQYTFGSDSTYDALTTIVIPNVTSIPSFAFNDAVDTKMQNLTKIVVNPNLTIADMGVRNGNADLYSTGSLAETNITINGTNIGLTGKIFYYSETQPTDTTNTYWRYVNGEPTVWVVD